jgi:hypothetical protein
VNYTLLVFYIVSEGGKHLVFKEPKYQKLQLIPFEFKFVVYGMDGFKKRDNGWDGQRRLENREG